jgi:tRNA G18 (ribose-2'-O)-methylase SpoU
VCGAGSEGDGLRDSVLRECDERVAIQSLASAPSSVDSLNGASFLLFVVE